MPGRWRAEERARYRCPGRARWRVGAAVCAAALAVLFAGCAGSDSGEGDAGATASPDAASAGGGVSVAEPVCLAGGGFAASGDIDVGGGESGDARQLGALRWERHEGCERVVLDLSREDGSPAMRPGPVEAQVLRAAGVVRIALRDVVRADPEATDATFEGPLAGSAFAVSSPDGAWVFVDLHLAGAAEVRVAAHWGSRLEWWWTCGPAVRRCRTAHRGRSAW